MNKLKTFDYFNKVANTWLEDLEEKNEEDILTGKATEVKTFGEVATDAEIEAQVEFELTAKEAPDNIIGFT